MTELIDRDCVAKVLLEIDPLVRSYHKNVIRVYTGTDPSKARELELEDSIRFLKHAWGMCLQWGNQRTDYIGHSIQELAKFLQAFRSRDQIHNLKHFADMLEKNPDLKPVRSVGSNDVVRLTELLQRFPSVGIKTAALIMRFICLDCDFFTAHKRELIPPLDRVNYRMCMQLFGSSFPRSKLRGSTVGLLVVLLVCTV